MAVQTVQSKQLKEWRPFTAVDLVTLAALAALCRAMDYVGGVVQFLFPFSTFIMAFSVGLTMIVAALIVRKTGTFTLYTVALQAINFFLQGEVLVAAIIMLIWGILSDLYVYNRLKQGADPFKSRRDMLICGFLMSVMWVLTVYGILFPFIYLLTPGVVGYIGLFVGGLIVINLGSYLGFDLGNKIKGLIG